MEIFLTGIKILLLAILISSVYLVGYPLYLHHKKIVIDYYSKDNKK